MCTLLALLLLAGMVAMHHLAGGDHHAGHAAAASGIVERTGPNQAEPVGDHGGPGAHLASALSLDTVALDTVSLDAVTLDTAALDTVASMLARGAGPAAEACAVALMGALVLLLSHGRGWRSAAPTPVLARVGLRSDPPGRGPPRDLLAQLCVLRT